MTVSDPRADLEDALIRAVRSPSSHNSQAWRLELRSDGDFPLLCAYVDEKRSLRSLPSHRTEMLLSLGALWHAIDLEMQNRGWRLERVASPKSFSAPLAAHIIRSEADLRPTRETKFLVSRRTARGPYLRVPLSDEECRSVVAAVTSSSHRSNEANSVRAVVLTDPQVITDVSKLAAVGAPRDFLHPTAWRETWSFLRSEAELVSRPDGFAWRDIFGPEHGIASFFAQFLCSPRAMPITGRLGLARILAGSLARLIRNSPGLLLLTAGADALNDDETCADAGAAMHSVWLGVEALGLGLHPVSVLIQYRDLRAELARRTGVQDPFFVARIGHPENPTPGRPTPRRPTQEILECETS